MNADGEPAKVRVEGGGEAGQTLGEQPADRTSDGATPSDERAEEDPANNNGPPPEAAVPLSKNQQKKLKRTQKWEAMRDDRKRRRKEKRLSKQAEKRAEKQAAAAAGETGPAAPTAAALPSKEHVLVPVSLIFDCAFESYMRETELISLSSQITRSYAANRAAARSTRLYISSWGGKLQTRYETLLAGQHRRWQNVSFVADDFVAAGRLADAAMRGAEGGTVVDVLEGGEGEAEGEAGNDTETGTDGNTEPNIVYLTSDSPHTLTRLAPYTSYVIGGLVDKNREKGLCYKRAQELGIRTARLPIGDYMVMASRQVLTTNHVVEIMLRWLETGDWADAFTHVIPKRKGGHLREGSGGHGNDQDHDHGEGEGEGEGGSEAAVADETEQEPDQEAGEQGAGTLQT